MLPAAIIFITAAFLCYTIGVWSEKINGTLKRRHLILFWVGLVFDTTGTTLMGRLAGNALLLNFHSLTGIAAIILMLVHAVWATLVLRKNDAKQKNRFHRFSIFVWALWMIPFLSGMVMGMAR